MNFLRVCYTFIVNSLLEKIMIEAAVVQSAVSFFIGKAVEGVAKDAGGDAYKTTLEKLKGFFSYKFAGKPELTQAKENPEGLVSLITEEASRDETFRSDLEKLVLILQELADSSQSASTLYSNVDSVANLDIGSVSGGNVASRDVIAGNEVKGGQNSIGGDQRGSTFR